MTDEKLETMIKRINEEINFCVYEYKTSGRTMFYYRQLGKIHGMIDILQIATGKRYVMDESGVKEVKEA